MDKGFDHFKIALSVGVQRMVRADLAASGVTFTLDTETGFRDAVLINAAYGLGDSLLPPGQRRPPSPGGDGEARPQAPCERFGALCHV